MLVLLTLLGLLACQKDPLPPRAVKVEAVLPLSGSLSQAGKAFAKGLEGALRDGVPDSVTISLSLLDNASTNDSATQLLLAPRSPYLVAGLGYAVAELPARTGGFALWVGQEAEAPAGWTSFPAPLRSQADSLLAWCRKAPKPLAIVFGATSQWAPLVQEHLAPRLDSVTLIPHDGGEIRWNREATRLITLKPASILLWHGLEQARSLLARPDLDTVLSRARLLGPRGSTTREAWEPVWEPAPAPDSLELARWQRMGAQAGTRLRQAILDPALAGQGQPLRIVPQPEGRTGLIWSGASAGATLRP